MTGKQTSSRVCQVRSARLHFQFIWSSLAHWKDDLSQILWVFKSLRNIRVQLRVWLYVLEKNIFVEALRYFLDLGLLTENAIKKREHSQELRRPKSVGLLGFKGFSCSCIFDCSGVLFLTLEMSGWDACTSTAEKHSDLPDIPREGFL